MSDSMIEREVKFDVEPGFALPDLSPMLPSDGRMETGSERLRSDYFDTVDHALLRAQVTLRRRSGSTDTGWQLKIPHPPFREEIRTELSGDAGGMPEELRRLLLGISGGQKLSQIASVLTERSVTRLLAADGRCLAEIDDDTVHASGSASGFGSGDAGAMVGSSWREIEIELGADNGELLHALGKQLRRAGARVSTRPSKLARAVPAVSAPAPAMDKGTGSRVRAGQVVAGCLAEQQRVMLSGDLALRRGDDSVIHKTRVATRRLRSILRVFDKLFEIERAAALDAELRWYAALLGEVRDRQVLQRRLDAMLTAVDDGLLLGPVRARIQTELRREQGQRWRRLQDQITAERYLTLLADLASWVQQPPWTAQAGKPTLVVTKLVRRADRKVSRRLAKANATKDVHLLHRARKAAKRARYAADAARPVLGKSTAAKQAKRYKKLQNLLGEHQDSLLSAELLRRLGAKAGTTEGENGFAFGILHEREEHNARIARAKARRTAKRYD